MNEREELHKFRLPLARIAPENHTSQIKYDIFHTAKIVKGECNRAGLHPKIAEPPPIFCKDSESREKTGACFQFSEAHPI